MYNSHNVGRTKEKLVVLRVLGFEKTSCKAWHHALHQRGDQGGCQLALTFLEGILILDYSAYSFWL